MASPAPIPINVNDHDEINFVEPEVPVLFPGRRIFFRGCFRISSRAFLERELPGRLLHRDGRPPGDRLRPERHLLDVGVVAFVVDQKNHAVGWKTNG